MSQAAAASSRHTVTVTDAGPCKKKLSIQIPADVVAEKLRDSMDVLVTQTELPGFRRGRAPRRLVERKFGGAVKDETKNQLVAEAYSKAVEEHKLKVIGDPFSESLPKAELEAGKSFSFDVDVEVMPEFKLPELDGVAIRKPVMEVSDKMVDDELKKICINEGELESRDKTEPGDYLTGHAVMKGKDGTEFYNIKGAVVQAPTADKDGKGMILGVMVDDFAKQIGKPKIGDTFTVKVKGPESHEVEGIRGADLTITFQVERIDRIIPLTVEQVVQKAGLGSADDLKNIVRTRLQNLVEIEQQSAMRQQIAKYLLDTTKMELPERATAAQAARTLERQRMEMMYRGVEPMKIEENIAALRSASRDVAVRELKLFFILAQAAEELKVQVTEGEINGRIAMMARERQVRPEKLRQELIQSNRVGMIWSQIRDHKTMDAVLAKAKVTELPAEEFNKLMEAEGKAERSGKKA